MSTLRLWAAAEEGADDRASGCLVAEAAEMALRFRHRAVSVEISGRGSLRDGASVEAPGCGWGRCCANVFWVYVLAFD